METGLRRACFARQNAGLRELHLLRNTENPNEVILLFSVEDPEKAKAFAASDDLRQAMQKAGVSDKPDVIFSSSGPKSAVPVTFEPDEGCKSCCRARSKGRLTAIS